MYSFRLLIVFLFSIFPMVVDATNESVGLDGLVVSTSWSQALPAVAKNGVAYLIIKNNSTRQDKLISASSPIAERVEIHSHQHIDGVMRMRKVEHVDLAQGTATIFEPGGLHVMLIGLKEPLKKDLIFPLSLIFMNAGELVTNVTVR